MRKVAELIAGLKEDEVYFTFEVSVLLPQAHREGYITEESYLAISSIFHPKLSMDCPTCMPGYKGWPISSRAVPMSPGAQVGPPPTLAWKSPPWFKISSPSPPVCISHVPTFNEIILIRLSLSVGPSFSLSSNKILNKGKKNVFILWLQHKKKKKTASKLNSPGLSTF
jgi:hypothetical protein